MVLTRSTVRIRITVVPLLTFTLVAASHSAAGINLEYEVTRLSERVLTVSTLTGNSRAVAINSDEGIVLLDTFWSPGAAMEVREIIEAEFGREGFVYVVNSTADDMSSRGNGAFPDATIIAHEDCRLSLVRSSENLESELGRRADEFHERVVRSERQLEEMDAGSEEAVSHRNWIDLCRRVEEDMRLGYEIVLPDITFSDRMSVRLSGLTIELLYFGSSGNSGDTFVLVPDEGLVFLGDVFHAGHSLPLLRGAMREVDVAKWLESLDYVLSREWDIKHVIRANGEDIWTVKRLGEQRDFIYGILKDVGAADLAGLGLDETLAGFEPLGKRFPFVRTWDVFETFGDEILMQDVSSMVRFLWRKTHSSAASKLASVLEQDGADAARRAFDEMRSASSSEYYFSEAELNSKGYEYLGQDMIPEAIFMFKLAVLAYPQSANVYDSLGEAYMTDGQTQLAIENYRRSLEINPENANAVRMLERLESE
jgi:glyoxylase-like metal-dependent hydrolase (beta-lactamase superfamily II)